MSSVDQVWTIANTLLSTVVSQYAAAGVSLPSRQYVADGGEVALDCELVAVALSRVYRGVPGVALDAAASTLRCASVRAAEYHVWIVRCASTPQESGDPPSTTSIESYAEPMMTDAWLLPSSLTEAALDGSLGFSCDDVFIGQLVVAGPEGAHVGVDLTVQVALGNV